MNDSALVVPAAASAASADDAPAEPAPREGVRLKDWLELGKARLMGLVLLTTLTGAIASGGREIFVTHLPTILWLLLGTIACAMAAGALNEVREAERDGRMRRTATRPIPAGIIPRSWAIAFGAILGSGGVALLALLVNPLTAGLGLLTIVLYVWAYTPMKTVTSFNTHLGAVCGAVPPIMGVTGTIGALNPLAISLGMILYIWQIPHFLAIAWRHRGELDTGGFRMLPAYDAQGGITGRMILLYTTALLPLSGLPVWVDFLPGLYWLVLLPINALFLWAAWRFHQDRTDRAALRVFLVSILWLPVWMAVLTVFALLRTP